MPYKDPEKAREAKRLNYQANLESNRERQRQYNETHREERRVAARARYWAKRDQLLEQHREWAKANPEKVRENMRKWRAAGGRPPIQRLRNEAVTRLWQEQDRCCYLCEKPVPLEEAHLDHDHRCCAHNSLCAFCIRGVACRGCNHLVGNAGDDPERLELIAKNLRAKLTEIDARLATKPAEVSRPVHQRRAGR